MITDADRVPLDARAWIADGTRGALVTADGTVDWYCPTGWAGDPACWRLLDPAGGALRVGPSRGGTGATRTLPATTQGYRSDTNVTETVLEGSGGRRLSITDLLPWPGPGVMPAGRLVRLIRALAGPVEVEVEVMPAGPWRAAREVQASEDGLVVDGVLYRTGARLEAAPLDRDTPRWRGTRRLESGEAMVVTIDRVGEHVPLSADATERLAAETVTAWRSWLAPVTYDGPYRDAVTRSLLAVRSLIGPHGAPAAAGTTSLPRRVGSERTTDDRYIRWRDAAAAAATFAAVGLDEDAEAAEAWLRRAVSEAALPWPPMVDADGQPVPPAEEVSAAGWRRTQPVLVGRLAGPPDLDLYGDVLGAVGASRGEGGGGPRGSRLTPLSAAWSAVSGAADWVADFWREPDVGVWATAGGRRLFVASRVQAWWALERAARLARAADPLDLAATAWQQEARTILDWLESDGLAFDGGLRRDGAPMADDEADAALVRIAWRGPWPVEHPIVRTTVDRVIERLGAGRLIYRYSDRIDDGRAGPDSPDLLASLWMVRALAALRRWDEAHERMEAVLGRAGPNGLLSEAADPVSGELLGNLPSTGVHLAVIDAALALTAGPD